MSYREPDLSSRVAELEAELRRSEQIRTDLFERLRRRSVVKRLAAVAWPIGTILLIWVGTILYAAAGSLFWQNCRGFPIGGQPGVVDKTHCAVGAATWPIGLPIMIGSRLVETNNKGESK